MDINQLRQRMDEEDVLARESLKGMAIEANNEEELRKAVALWTKNQKERYRKVLEEQKSQT